MHYIRIAVAVAIGITIAEHGDEIRESVKDILKYFKRCFLKFCLWLSTVCKWIIFVAGKWILLIGVICGILYLIYYLGKSFISWINWEAIGTILVIIAFPICFLLLLCGLYKITHKGKKK